MAAAGSQSEWHACPQAMTSGADIIPRRQTGELARVRARRRLWTAPFQPQWPRLTSAHQPLPVRQPVVDRKLLCWATVALGPGNLLAST